MQFFSVFDIFLAVIYSIVIIVFAQNKKRGRVFHNRAYDYYIKGLIAHIIGGVAFSFIYMFYYNGGDTIDYMQTTLALFKLLTSNFNIGLGLLFGIYSGEGYFDYFDNYNTGYPAVHIFLDPKSFSVSRFTLPISIIAFNGFVTTTVVLASLAYKGSWNLFLLLYGMYPKIQKELAFAILFVPSVIFWGSGLMKDTYTFSATCWFVVGFFRFFIEKRKYLSSGGIILLSIYVLISIKPYILFSIVPGALLWLSFNRIKSIKNSIVRLLLGPILIFLSIIGANFFLDSMSDSMGKFSVDNAIQQAQIMQQDLIREDSYGSNSFNLGEYDGGVFSMLSKAPIAVNAALFRPYLIEAKNPVMFFAALENTYILFLTLSVLIKVGIFKIFKFLKNDSFLTFTLLFTIVFAFMVGFTTANFGALVRYKIPMIPFYLCFLFICLYYNRNQTSSKDG